MNTLKLIWLALVQLIRQIPQLPQAMAQAAQERRRQSGLKELEAERLDRIRNPSKYLGK